METGKAPVKSKGEIVGEASFPIFDTLEEAAQQIGEKECIDLLNSQIKTNAMNEVRAEKTGKPSKARVKEMAVLNISVDELASCAGEPAKVQALIARKEAEIREQYGIED